MVTAIKQALQQSPTVLIQAATGAGKTVVFAELIRQYVNEFPKIRILVLVHREIIVKQNADKLRSVWKEAPISIACASIDKKIDLKSNVVFASVQTLASKKTMEILPMFHLIIVDEAHRLPPKNTDSQYKLVIDRLYSYYQRTRLLGFTATPYRLNWGNIYGREHKRLSNDEPCKNWFNDLNHSVGIRTLQSIGIDDENPDAPYLCGMRAWNEDISISQDLESISKTAGEFNQGELSTTMKKTVHLQSALDAYRKHSEGRKRCVVFAVDISHAQKLCEVFENAGYKSFCVHSKQAKEVNKHILSEFDAGNIPIVTSVGQLSEGWDCRSVDMLMMCRPTLSAALFVQMIGRGLRTFPGKMDVLVLDLAGCFFSHGSPYEPILPDYSQPGRKKEPKTRPVKKCPACGFENAPNTWCCTQCGEILLVCQIVEAPKVVLKELNLDAINDARDKQQQILKSPEFRCTINKILFSRHITQAGADCLKASARLNVMDDDGKIGNIEITANHFYRLDGPARFYFLKFFKLLTGTKENAPSDIHEAIEMMKNWEVGFTGLEATVMKDGKFWKVKGW